MPSEQPSFNLFHVPGHRHSGAEQSGWSQGNSGAEPSQNPKLPTASPPTGKVFAPGWPILRCREASSCSICCIRMGFGFGSAGSTAAILFGYIWCKISHVRVCADTLHRAWPGRFAAAIWWWPCTLGTCAEVCFSVPSRTWYVQMDKASEPFPRCGSIGRGSVWFSWEQVVWMHAMWAT